MSVVAEHDDEQHQFENEDDDDHEDEEDFDYLHPVSRSRALALVATLTGASFLNTVAIQSIVIMVPTLSRELKIPETSQQWMVSSYSLTFGCFLLFWGRIADIYGKRLIFILGSLWVCIVCAATIFAPHEVVFDILRALHGLGAAANVPTAIGILGSTFPPGISKNYAFSAYAAGAPLGGIFGNILSGVIIQYASWKWVFGTFSIIAGIITVAGIFVIPKSSPLLSSRQLVHNLRQPPSVDWIGAILVASGLIVLTYALTEGNIVGWSTPWVSGAIAGSGVALAIFIFWQLHLERRAGQNGSRPPLVKLSIFRNVRFSAVMGIAAFFFTSFSNYLLYATYYFQYYQDLSPINTVLRFLPTGIMGVIMIIIVAKLLGRLPTVFILGFGTLCGSIACLLFAVPIHPETSYFAWAFFAMILAVIGVDTAWPCLTLYTSQSLAPEDQAVGGALINSIGQFGRAIGLAVVTSIQSAVMAGERKLPLEQAFHMKPHDDATLSGIRGASWANFGFGILGFIVVILTFRNMEIIGKSAPIRRSYDENIPESADP